MLVVLRRLKEYTSKTRAVVPMDGYSSTKCVYKTPDGRRKCIVGQFMARNHRCYDSYSVYGVNREDIPPLYNLDYYFLDSCQNIHDKDGYWSDEGPTEKCLSEIDFLTKRVLEGYFD